MQVSYLLIQFDEDTLTNFVENEIPLKEKLFKNYTTKSNNWGKWTKKKEKKETHILWNKTTFATQEDLFLQP